MDALFAQGRMLCGSDCGLGVPRFPVISAVDAHRPVLCCRCFLRTYIWPTEGSPFKSMPRIYLSSTFVDLKAHREAVYQQLHRMQHDIIAMEDYVARDDRPAAQCLRDVARSGLYLGLFAWRYGFIPAQDNPRNLSITELEYREAEAKSIPRLVFLLDDSALWPPPMLDSQSGDGDHGRRIRELRQELVQERLASFFTSPEDLSAKVAAAVHLATTVANASDAAFDLEASVGADNIDRPEILFSQSYVPYLVHQLQQLGESPLLKIDLRDGTHWWSTRLYALATLAAEFTSVEWLLFVDEGTRYVGMARPRDLTRALAAAQPELDSEYRLARDAPAHPQIGSEIYAGQVLEGLVARFRALPGGEESLRFPVSSSWLRGHVPALSTVHVEHPGSFDPLATYQLLQSTTPYVPITSDHGQLIKVIDRVGVATDIARTVVERQFGRG